MTMPARPRKRRASSSDATPPPPRFNEEHRRRLADLGVSREQIACLEVALMTVALSARSPPPRNDIRDMLNDHRDGLATVERLFGTSDVAREALVLAQAAAYSMFRKIHINDLFASSIRLARSIVEEAIRGIEAADQRRGQSASPDPIRAIYDALVRGHGRAMKIEIGDNPNPLTLLPSRSEASKFKAIASICYEAAGIEEHAPDRAIRAFLIEFKQDRERISALREEIATEAGQQGVVTSDLPSKPTNRRRR
jgi:hypothetical protein